MSSQIQNTDGTQSSSDPSLTREQFLKKVLRGMAIAGGVVAAPAVVDKFLVPAAYAQSSSCTAEDTGGSNAGDLPTNGDTDAINFNTSGTNDTLCSGD